MNEISRLPQRLMFLFQELEDAATQFQQLSTAIEGYMRQMHKDWVG